MKRGSALLVVLGLLSFLVISAVAFSAYMRSARLPSSYLLRSSSSRNLVKAALAEAMNEIERAVGDNPHPGVGTATAKDSDLDTGVSPNRNQWRNRVFLGTNMLIGVDQTVATLTLEGLAYVPAPLINEVRYYSRRSPAAAWHQFDFDIGRFAFTAVDVSDYFDVNRVLAVPDGGGRTSADNARVTLAYLFENEDHSGWRMQPTVWDTFMDNFVSDDGSKVPLVSWADLNLAVWDKTQMGSMVPWCRFVQNGTEFVQDNDAERQILSNMVFVTDSCYNVSEEDAACLNIDNSRNQPFFGLSARIDDKTSYKKRGVDEIARNNNSFMTKFADNLSLPELVQLCDYLDVDSVPTSLAMPTVERVPMVVGVSLAAGSTLQYEITPKVRKVQKKDANGQITSEVTITCYTLRLKGELHPMVAAVYPFKHSRGSDDTETFQAQVAATVTLVPKDSESKLRRKSATSPAVCPWETSEKTPAAVAYGGAGDYKSVVMMRSKPVSLSIKRSPSSDSDCLIDVDPELSPINVEFAATMEKSKFDESDQNDVCTLRVAQEYDKEGNPVGDAEVTRGFLPSNEDLSGTFKAKPEEIGDGDAFAPVVQLWVRIVNSAGDTVDLMPACVSDDKMPSELLQAENLKSAFERPFLRFYDKDGKMTLNLSEAWFAKNTAAEMTIYPQAYVADDPRFNHAPEDLVAVENLTEEVQDYWLANNAAKNGDGDIYMATSDAGYLQSRFEIAHLLRITGLSGSDMWGVLDNGGYDGVARTAFGNAPSKDAQWRTYSQYKVNGRAGDDIEKYITVKGGSRGTRVCPYTPDTAVMMGALANTPRDWWAASTNDTTSAKQLMLTKIDEALKYTFSEHSSDNATKVRWQDLEKLARFFIDRFRSSTSDDLCDTYDSFDWDETLFDDIESGSSVTLDSVDRKFLHGFWHECFAVQQQLYLIFVRAEPMMMGSGAAGQMPPMLGARAVALVWRSPERTKNDTNAPHPMRVLFYRQLE